MAAVFVERLVVVAVELTWAVDCVLVDPVDICAEAVVAPDRKRAAAPNVLIKILVVVLIMFTPMIKYLVV